MIYGNHDGVSMAQIMVDNIVVINKVKPNLNGWDIIGRKVVVIIIKRIIKYKVIRYWGITHVLHHQSNPFFSGAVPLLRGNCFPSSDLQDQCFMHSFLSFTGW